VSRPRGRPSAEWEGGSGPGEENKDGGAHIENSTMYFLAYSFNFFFTLWNH